MEKLNPSAVKVSLGSQGWAGALLVGNNLEPRQKGSKGTAGMGSVRDWWLEHGR